MLTCLAALLSIIYVLHINDKEEILGHPIRHWICFGINVAAIIMHEETYLPVQDGFYIMTFLLLL